MPLGVIKVIELTGTISPTVDHLNFKVPLDDINLNRGNWVLFLRDLTAINAGARNPAAGDQDIFFTIKCNLCSHYGKTSSNLVSQEETSLARFHYTSTNPKLITFSGPRYYINNPQNQIKISFSTNPSFVLQSNIYVVLSLCMQRID